MMLTTQHLLTVCVLPLQDENCTMFLIAGYSRYNRPYVWVSNTGLAILFITLYQLGSAVMNHYTLWIWNGFSRESVQTMV